MAHGIYYSITDTPLQHVVEIGDGAQLVFFFTRPQRLEVYEAKLPGYTAEVQRILSNRYHGIKIAATVPAAVDLYYRTEPIERRVEYVDVYGRVVELNKVTSAEVGMGIPAWIGG